MKLADFDFDLPEDLIALRPARPRDSARLLHVAADGALADRGVLDLPALLNPGDLLVFNDTRVIPAALAGVRPARPVGGGGDSTVEINLHKRAGEAAWLAFARPAKRLREGDEIRFDGGLAATVTDKREGGEIALSFDRSGVDLDRAIVAAGAPPLPPYIASKRAPDETDLADYQTIYADPEKAGSVAAPTAGLHFTDRLFAALDDRGVKRARVTLHVGAGTFLPVKTEDVSEHRMHAEWYEIGADAAAAINETRAAGGRIIPVGTTSLRTLESAADADGTVRAEARDTDIFITPGYRFRVVDALLTNFHLPKSTLFMLVSALAGLETMQRAYAHAIAEKYRFFSYGDACFIERAG
ncbi:tRNA preQ1(34) S-adenosylmethionine ribosyltransferase-isomerase QueA [Marinicauda salina]|uniref:S-adenosylmethionine:tRNA ribosyltransferase-isomerase n=1 Tax=Marinicauda salina TaxID=2135793 RepID=A0A2U2BRI2_9PROT|nr:tRNA preQ1(34) S-adenosylmethionine ribosyltransferase-isomerase QueA [Marinicauda salina]PWE16623.1 tRNA preQ1(34) S-adenosylmethionine ribosyltransferase-isomerase QueA [Marinicauda salina]